MQDSHQEGNTNQPGIDAGAGLDKVRDILFGAQARDFENRFAQLEAQLLQKTSDARDEAHRRLEELRSHLISESQQIHARIESENAERNRTISQLTEELRAIARELHERLQQLDSKAANSDESIRDHFTKRSEALAAEIENKATTLANALRHEVGVLSSDKLNRADMAAMLHDIAHRIVNGHQG